MIAVTLMCYLACLALGGLLVISRAASVWTADISSEITVQVRPIQGIDTGGQIDRAIAILSTTPGITRAVALDRSVAAELLEPWLGTGILLDDLPIPYLITVETDPGNPPDLNALEASLEREVPGVAVDTHRQWQAQLTRTAGTLIRIGYGILFLTSIATAVVIIFATQAAIDANRSVVEVLHLVGARDRFIASQIQRHFLKLGLKAGMIAAVLGAVSVALLAAYWPGGLPDSVAETGRGLLFGPPALTMPYYLAFLFVPLVATLISLITARVTVMRLLSEVP